MDCNPPGSSVHGIFQEGYWSGLPFSSPGDLPNTGIEPTSPVAPTLAGRFFTTEPPGKPSHRTNSLLHQESSFLPFLPFPVDGAVGLTTSSAQASPACPCPLTPAAGSASAAPSIPLGHISTQVTPQALFPCDGGCHLCSWKHPCFDLVSHMRWSYAV